MGLIGNLFGTPKQHEKEKNKNEVVEVPEFDITQYAKKLGVSIGVIAAASAGALKLFHVGAVTTGMVIGALGLTAAALLGACLVMAVDVAARAYLTGPGAAEKKKEKEGESAATEPPSGSELVAIPGGTLVWLVGDDEPHPVLAIASDGGKASSYLVAAGSKVSRPQGKGTVEAIDGSPKWQSADDVRAVKPAKWP